MLDGEDLVERARLLALGLTSTAGAEPGVNVGPGSVQQVAASSRLTQPVTPMEVDMEKGQGDKSGTNVGERDKNPSNGIVVMGGKSCAWQITAGGLQLTPVGYEGNVSAREGLLALQDRGSRVREAGNWSLASASDVFRERAKSSGECRQPGRSQRHWPQAA